VVKLAPDLSHFLVVHDIQSFCEQDPYRYVRHASLYGEAIVFCAEIGKEMNKIVYFKINDLHSVQEFQG
jgi:hypothetical protein